MVIGVNKMDNAIFFKTVLNLDRDKKRFLHVIPNFSAGLLSYFYEIYGTDDTRIETKVEGVFNLNRIISFYVNMGETYFIKIIGNYENNKKEIFLFYKVEDDFEEDTEESESESESEEEKKSVETELDNIQDVDVDVDKFDDNEKITKYISGKHFLAKTGLDLYDESDLECLR